MKLILLDDNIKQTNCCCVLTEGRNRIGVEGISFQHPGKLLVYCYLQPGRKEL